MGYDRYPKIDNQGGKTVVCPPFYPELEMKLPFSAIGSGYARKN